MSACIGDEIETNSPSNSPLPWEIAHISIKNVGMVSEAIEESHGHALIAKDLDPIGEFEIGPHHGEGAVNFSPLWSVFIVSFRPIMRHRFTPTVRQVF